MLVLGGNDGAGVKNGREPDGKIDEVGQEVVKVTKACRERREPDPEAESDDHIQQHHDRKKQDFPARHMAPNQHEHHHEHHRDAKIDQSSEGFGQGQDEFGEIDPRDELLRMEYRAADIHNEVGKEIPRDHAREGKQGVFDLDLAIERHQNPKKDAENRQGHERLDHRPKHAQQRLRILRPHIAQRKHAYEPAIGPNLAQVSPKPTRLSLDDAFLHAAKMAIFWWSGSKLQLNCGGTRSPIVSKALDAATFGELLLWVLELPFPFGVFLWVFPPFQA